MRSKNMLLILCIAMIFIFSNPGVSPALDDISSMDCDGGIVVPGDSEDSVREKCGDPQKVTQQDKYAPVIWIYNFGPTKFVYYVTLTNGIVEQIQTGDYGH